MTSTQVRPVQGAKKDGGGRTPVEAKDSLRSTQWAEVLDLVSEGEISGLVGGLKGVFLDNVPIENADGTRNFAIESFASTVGTQGQVALSGFDTSQSEVGVMIRVRAGTPVVRSIPGGAANKVRVTLGIPELTSQASDTGDLSGTSVEVAIDIQSSAGGFVERWRKTVDGKTTTRYQLAVVIDLQGAGPWDIRMRRITADSTSVTLRNETWFDSYTLINSARLRYPNSALCGLRVNAEHHQRVPTRAYHMRGRIIQVPSNYDPVTRNYTGAWNGTFKLAYSNNPAWVYFDLATHTRYGLGRRVEAAKFNKWELYAIGRYCDAVNAAGAFVGVPDGRGGMEPRFTCNLYLQRPEEAYKVLQDLASIFRGMTAYTGGSLQVVQDAPDDAYTLFVPANVVGGDFKYEGSSRSVKKSGCVVWWNNPGNQYKLEPEFFQDSDLVAKYGVENMELSPIGITSRGQAMRLAKWAVYTEAHEGETVSFSVGSIGAAVPLGRVFQVADPTVSGEQLGGLVSVATSTQVTLDRDVTLRAGEVYTLHVMVPDAAQTMGLKSLSKTVTTGPGTTRVLTLSSALAVVPPTQSVWVLESSAVAPTSWRCIRVAEGKTPGTYDISGVAHQPGKYNWIEYGIRFDEKPVSRLREDAPVATGLSLRETIYRSGGVACSRVSIGWLPAAPGLHYRVSWRLSSGPWTMMPLTGGQSVDLDNVAAGLLEVSVRTVNPLGTESGATLDGSLLVLGDQTTPWGDSATNALPNTEFSAGNTDGWTLGGWITGKPPTYIGLEGVRDPTRTWVPAGIDAVVIVQGARVTAADTYTWGAPSGGTDRTIVGVAYSEQLIPVIPGDELMASMWVAAHRCQVGLYLEFKDVNGAGVPGSKGPAWTTAANVVGGKTLATWQRLSVADTVPANAAYARVLFAKGNTLSGQTDSLGWMCRPQLSGATAGQTDPGDYTPGGARNARQLGYLGDLDATKGAPAGTMVGGRLAQDVIAELADIASDGRLTPLEKSAAITDWQALDGEQVALVAQANSYGIVAERDAYTGALTALAAYLNSLAPAWNDLTTTTSISAATWRPRWVAAYTTRQALQNRISAEAGARAIWATVSGAGKPQDNATVGAEFGVNVAGQITETSAPSYVADRALHEGGAVRSAVSINATAVGVYVTSVAVQAIAGGLASVIAAGMLQASSSNSSSQSVWLELRKGGAVLASSSAITAAPGTGVSGLALVMWSGQISGAVTFDLYVRCSGSSGIAADGTSMQVSVFK